MAQQDKRGRVRLTVRVSEAVRRQIRRIARAEDRSENYIATQLIAEAMDARDRAAVVELTRGLEHDRMAREI